VDPAVVEYSLLHEPDECADIFRTVLEAQAAGQDIAGARVVLVVDQFEELFTLCEDVAERDAFIELLELLTSGAEPACLAVLGLRADFYGQCAAFPQLRDALEREQVFVGPMSATELLAAIERPALAVGMELEAGLTELLLRDIGAGKDGDGGSAGGAYEAGRLPLIAHALQATWEQRVGRVLTVAGYTDTGGIGYAIANTAERTYADLSDTTQQAARSLFLRLVKLGDETQDTCRSISRTDLLSRSPAGPNAEAARQAFTAARLLTVSKDRIQISHEALLRAWPRLQQWINSDRVGNLVGQQLEDDATAWERSGHDSSALLRGSRLGTALSWVRDRPDDSGVSPVVDSFLRESRRQQSRAVHLQRAAVAVLAVVALVAAGTAWFAVRQRTAAEASSREASLSQVIAEAGQVASTDSSVAADLNVLAYRMKPSNAIYTKLISAENTPLASVLPVSSGIPDSIAYSPSGDLLAAATGTSVQLWNVSSSPLPRPLGSPLPVRSGTADSIAFSPVGNILAVATSTDVELWNLSTPSLPALISTLQTSSAGPVNSVAFSPDGRTLAVGASSLQLWNVASPAHPRVSATIAPLGYYSGHLSPFLSVAFSPNGRVLAAGAADAAAFLWGVTDPAKPVTFGWVRNDTYNVTSVAFSPDSDLLATGSADHTANVYDITGVTSTSAWPPTYPALTGHTAAILAVAMSPDGNTLATASADRTIRLWHLPRTVLIAHSGYVDGLALSPSRGILASGGYDDTMRLWNVANPAAPTDLSGPVAASGVVDAISFRPDGRLLAAAEHNIVQLWQVSDPRHPIPVGKPIPGFGPNVPALYVTSVAFSPDGHTLASGSQDYTIRLWDVSNPGRAQEIGGPLTGDTGGINALVFGAGGHVLIAGDGSYAVRIWNLDAATAIQRICAATVNVLTPAQWRQDVPELPYNPPCGASR
jgi:WD40 repeat protein